MKCSAYINIGHCPKQTLFIHSNLMKQLTGKFRNCMVNICNTGRKKVMKLNSYCGSSFISHSIRENLLEHYKIFFEKMTLDSSQGLMQKVKVDIDCEKNTQIGILANKIATQSKRTIQNICFLFPCNYVHITFPI